MSEPIGELMVGLIVTQVGATTEILTLLLAACLQARSSRC